MTPASQLAGTQQCERGEVPGAAPQQARWQLPRQGSSQAGVGAARTAGPLCMGFVEP